GDTDFLIRPTSENASKVLAALDDFGFGELGIELSDLTTEGKIIQLGQPPHRIDLITRISGVSFDEAWLSRQEANFDGLSVFVLGREALLKNKRATGRLKDAADVEALEGD